MHQPQQAQDDHNMALLTPYFPVYATSAPPDLILSALDRRVSAILGGAHAVLAPGEPWPFCRECGGRRPLSAVGAPGLVGSAAAPLRATCTRPGGTCHVARCAFGTDARRRRMV